MGREARAAKPYKPRRAHSGEKAVPVCDFRRGNTLNKRLPPVGFNNRRVDAGAVWREYLFDAFYDA
jgi:hypothetical protein